MAMNLIDCDAEGQWVYVDLTTNPGESNWLYIIHAQKYYNPLTGAEVSWETLRRLGIEQYAYELGQRFGQELWDAALPSLLDWAAEREAEMTDATP